MRLVGDIPEFVGYNSGANATIAMEFAQGAFRFGHSTMRESIDTMDPNGSITGKVMSIALEQAFLNPALFAEKGAASIAMGMVRQQMSGEAFRGAMSTSAWPTVTVVGTPGVGSNLTITSVRK